MKTQLIELAPWSVFEAYGERYMLMPDGNSAPLYEKRYIRTDTQVLHIGNVIFGTGSLKVPDNDEITLNKVRVTPLRDAAPQKGIPMLVYRLEQSGGLYRQGEEVIRPSSWWKPDKKRR